ncbi:hypothetical protein AA313_de0204426 [Arthrobotrys entomopaga]|nr:hypothetical protein AA313_de0204426 [Arthrobotrys entomopaga]
MATKASKSSRPYKPADPTVTPEASHQRSYLLRWLQLLAVLIRGLTMGRKQDVAQLTPETKTLDHKSPQYAQLVLEKDNVRIIKAHQIDSLDDVDIFGKGIKEMILNIKRNIVDQPSSIRVDKFPLVDSISNFLQLTSIQKLIMVVKNFSLPQNVDLALQKDLDLWDTSLDISAHCAREEPRDQYSATNGRKRNEWERDLQDFLINDAKLFKNLKLNQGSSRGISSHRINNVIGPQNVIENIPSYIQPDFLCGYLHNQAQAMFSISKDTMERIPKALLWTSPEAKTKKLSEALLLPYLAMELKQNHQSKYYQVLEDEVQKQLARCLSVIVERQARLEQSIGQVSSTPVFGITDIEDGADLWVMVRTQNPSTLTRSGWLPRKLATETNYYMCQIASYKLSKIEDMRGFDYAMAKIHEWEHNERRKHFQKLFRPRLQMNAMSAIRQMLCV